MAGEGGLVMDNYEIIQIITLQSITKSLNSNLQKFLESDIIVLRYGKYYICKLLISKENDEEFFKELYKIRSFREQVRKIQTFGNSDFNGSWNNKAILERI